jgi:hypothetical protein
MKNIKDLEKQADQTLNSLDNLQPVEANEFLHTKVVHRMQSRQEAKPMVYNKLMVRLAAVLCLFVCINGISYIALRGKNITAVKTSAGVDVFAEAYGLNNNLNSY